MPSQRTPRPVRRRGATKRLPGLKIALSAAALLLVSGSASHAQQTVVFDNVSNFQNSVSGASITATASTPNTFMGDGYTLLAGTTSITGFDVLPYNNSGTNFTGLRGTIYVWGTVNTGAVSAAAPAFSNLLGTYVFNSTGTFNSGSYYTFQTGSPGATPAISLTTPLAISSNTIGITTSYQGTTDGVTYATANNLTSIISTGSPPSVGSLVFNGYYRNANNEADGNFTSALRALGGTPAPTNQSVALRVFGIAPTPEPSSPAVLGVGVLGLGLLAVRRRRRSASVSGAA